MKKKFKLPKYDGEIKQTTFSGSSYFNVIAMYFISHKHDNACVIFSEPYDVDIEKTINKKHKHDKSCVLLPKKIDDIPSTQREVSLRLVQGKNGNDWFISVPEPNENFWGKFTKCGDKRFIVLPFGFYFSNSGHANWLLYDKITKSLERFESYGKVNDKKCLNPDNLDKEIEKLFKENLPKDFIKKYYSPLTFLEDKNIQTLQEAENEKLEVVGFCSVWSCFWIDLRLSNPDLDRDTVYNLAMKELEEIKKSGKSYTQFIRNYSQFLVDISNEIKKMEKKK